MSAKIKSALLKQFAKNVDLPTARRNVEKQLNLLAGQTLSYDKVYFVAIGEANPIVLPENATKAQIAKAIRNRRNGKDGAIIPNSGNTKGMSLTRWETVAASAGMSVSQVRKLYGVKPSYTGRGTKIALTKSAS